MRTSIIKLSASSEKKHSQALMEIDRLNMREGIKFTILELKDTKRKAKFKKP